MLLQGKSLKKRALLAVGSFSKLWFSIFGRRFGMNAIWVKKLAFSALSCAMASGTIAMANTIPVNVDFSCTDGSGAKTAGGSTCPSVGPGLVPIKSWTQGFTGSSGAGTINVGTSSTNAQGSEWVPEVGNPAPAIGSAAGTQTLTITDTGDYLFSFQSIDLGTKSDNGMRITVTGFDEGVQEFTFTDQVCLAGCGPGVTWIGIDDTLFSGDLLTEVVISVKAGTVVYEDNLDVNATSAPEPGSLFLLGTGLLGLAFVAFRKSRNASLSLHS
jgi:hypothetical protein